MYVMYQGTRNVPIMEFSIKINSKLEMHTLLCCILYPRCLVMCGVLVEIEASMIVQRHLLTII